MLKNRETTIQLTPTYSYTYEQSIEGTFEERASQQLDQELAWKKTTAFIKRTCDIGISLVGVLITLPVLPLIALLIKRESKGAVLFTQERIGLNNKPFNIIKFRTMYVDAEKNGPALSSAIDSRVTPFGRFLRRFRIDEFPQFINVIKGEMSIIGPRPERQFFIDQLIKDEPVIAELTKVKPGITSLGQVLFGYAENKKQMLQRAKLELFYLRNYSLTLDFKIFLYTLRTLVKAEGK
ncbi:sugar transferase [Carboxylicivirga sp. M1479]|uniref:sugar transferase n=1 Tax=Carboxylicivirga sp. M1479 TaxID=2594476 RepID=UPI001177B307|nr:sugar transferase [Carboxylicivirga sp. M1479]TRX71579.1 sugar transferase [Carboxylicivirga sp. M1479]